MAVRRFHAEVATAAATGIMGGIAVFGAAELGFGWSDHGPQAGYFPFYIGLLLIGASLWNLLRAVAARRLAPGGEGAETFLPRDQLIRVAQFSAALLVFVIGTLFLGIYVSAAAYIGWSAWRQGGYRLPVSLGIGAGFSVALYLVFEAVFRIPLLKGPIEPLLGIY